ncbi:MAG TPA: C39 family peptidase [Chloroflexota bacterium]|nr:C39 family peptidase [Chloroflexota bacterium]
MLIGRAVTRALCSLALLGLTLDLAPPVAAQTPIAIPAPPSSRATPSPTPRRSVPTTSRAAPDLSAPLPVNTPVPPTPTLVPTEAVLPATLTPTAVPPTPTPALSLVVGPTAAPIAVLPTEPPVALAPEPQATEPPATTATAPSDAALTPAQAPDPALARPANNALPFEPRPAPVRTFVRGLPDQPGAAGWIDDSLLWLGVPTRSQYDGTPYQAANCGPSALGMILEAYGLDMPTWKLREYANYLQGTHGYDDGIALDYLAELGRRANLRPMGLYKSGGGYRRWSVDDVRAAVLKGYPVIALTVYRLLPGSGGYGGNVNHYIVIDGLLGDDFLYNDSAYGGGGAKALVITPEQLEAAWARADIPYHAVAFGIGDGTDGLLGPDPTRFGRGGDARLLAAATHLDPRGPAERAARVAGESPSPGASPARVAPPTDPAIAAREALLNAGRPGASLLDAPLSGRTATASLLPTTAPPAPPDAADADDAPPAPDHAAALLRVLVILGGVGALYLLLLLKAGVARLNQARRSRSAG